MEICKRFVRFGLPTGQPPVPVPKTDALMTEQPKTAPETHVKKIWKDPVWASVIAAVILSVGGYLFANVTDAFAGEEVEEHKAASVVCTATGPNVNVRNGQGLGYSTLFQVSKGEYFHIIENGKEDVVHEKSGRWKRIAYEGKEGWMFSAYMRCE